MFQPPTFRRWPLVRGWREARQAVVALVSALVHGPLRHARRQGDWSEWRELRSSEWV